MAGVIWQGRPHFASENVVGTRIGSMLQTARNVAIIALAALVIAVLPGGGDAAQTVLAALSMAFLAAIAFFVYRIYREQQMTLMTLSDGRRAILFGSVGAIALLIVGFEEFESWAGGVAVWIVLMLGALLAIFLIWRQATTYL
jgi:hypothetical protein